MSRYHHDWKRMMNEFEHPEDEQPETFNRADMRQRYDTGFWVGAITAFAATIGLLLLVGLYYNGWQLP